MWIIATRACINLRRGIGKPNLVVRYVCSNVSVYYGCMGYACAIAIDRSFVWKVFSVTSEVPLMHLLWTLSLQYRMYLSGFSWRLGCRTILFCLLFGVLFYCAVLCVSSATNIERKIFGQSYSAEICFRISLMQRHCCKSSRHILQISVPIYVCFIYIGLLLLGVI